MFILKFIILYIFILYIIFYFNIFNFKKLSFFYTNSFMINHNLDDKKRSTKSYSKINDNSNNKFLIKRANNCPNPSKKGSKKNGNSNINQYYKNNALLKNRIDGWSASIFSVNIFKPACNAHDYCYHCVIKEYCDYNLFDQLTKICVTNYLGNGGILDAVKNAITKQYQNCITIATAFKVAVEKLGNSGFYSDQEHVDKYDLRQCCSSTHISRFVNQPFYLESD